MNEKTWIAIVTMILAGCGEDGAAPAASGGAGDGGSSAAGGTAGSGAAIPPFMLPDPRQPDGSYVPEPGSCGFEAPAFCDTFEADPAPLSRSGELAAELWSVTRGMPSGHASFDEAFTVPPALIPTCRPGLSNTAAAPDGDTVLCDPTDAVPTRHLFTASAAQNYGLNSYRIRRPFDFAGRTATIKLDVDLTNRALGGWPALAISEDPTPAPSFDFPERGSGPRNGVMIEFNRGWCATPDTVMPGFYTYADYVEAGFPGTDDCAAPHVTTARDALNHVEIYLTQNHLEVWASDASADGRTFANFQKLYEAEISLPFSRGYVNLIVRNHATLKYWEGAAWGVRWDNVGFDGPVVADFREFSVPEPLTPRPGISGCTLDGACQWLGNVIASHADGTGVCPPEANCEFPADARNVGYVVPNEDEEPVAIEIPGVDLAGATRARLALAVDYPWFEWNGVFPPPTAMNLRYRLNGGAWHDRFVSEIEANAFAGAPDGNGIGAGLLNQIVEVELAELVDGTNTLELLGAGLWTGAYRIAVVGVDLVLTTPP